MKTRPASFVDRIQQEFTDFVTSPAYPCVGARSVVRRRRCRVHVYGAMAEVETTQALARDLWSFAKGPRTEGVGFTAFAAVFLDVAPETELEFEARLWRQLAALTAIDNTTCSSDGLAVRSSDPADPRYAFSMHGAPYFVIGLHPAGSRIARRLPWPALVFNPHEQFDRLRAERKFEPMRRAIRARDVALQGDINPNLADVGERSEACQYSGRLVEEGWECPFHKRDA